MPEDLYVLGERRPSPRRSLAERLAAVARLAIAGLTIVLMMSWGGQFFAAPVLLPSLWWAIRTARAPLTAALLTIIGALLMAELGWALAYTLVRERQPWIWMAPAISFCGTVLLFAAGRRRSAP